MSVIKPCAETIAIYHAMVFRDCEGFIALRSYPDSKAEKQKHKKASKLQWIKNDDHAIDRMVAFAKEANEAYWSCFCIPGTVLEGKAGAPDVLQMQTVLIDIDDGDCEAKLAYVIEKIGHPSMIVESGGMTEHGTAKLHAYWRLNQAVTGGSVQELAVARGNLARAIGADEHFKSAHQPIRIAGSVHHKNQPTLVTIRSVK